MIFRGLLLASLGTFALLVVCGCIGLYGQPTESKSLPAGVYKALAADESAYCAQFLGDFKKGCRQNFRAALTWREIQVSPAQNAILIELRNIMGACGSAGCTVYVFVQRANGTFVQVLGKQGDVGELGRITVLRTTTKDHYDIQKTWRDGKTHTIYEWDGLRYSALQSPE